jgi:CubicO group peptidase (beta-lactamase class C family)
VANCRQFDRASANFTRVSGASSGVAAQWVGHFGIHRRANMLAVCRPLVRALVAWLVIANPTAPRAETTPQTTAPPALEDGWPVADPSQAGWDGTVLADLAAKLAAGEFEGKTSVLIAHRGKLVYEGYYGEGSRDHGNDVRSASKTVTAILAGIAIDKGLIDGEDAKVYASFPDKKQRWYPDARKRAITLADLLTMSSIWECNDENPWSSGNEERMYVGEDWVGFALDLPLRGFRPGDEPAKQKHGRAFSYCTAGSFVAGALIERAAKQGLDKFAQKYLHEPLGIRSVTWGYAPTGEAMGGGGTRYRSRDLLKLGELLRLRGRWGERQIVSAAWVDAMMSPHVVAREDAEYGYLIWRFRIGEGDRARWVWGMSGNGGNYVFISPELELVCVVTSTAYNQGSGHEQSQAILRDFVLKAVPRATAD